MNVKVTSFAADPKQMKEVAVVAKSKAQSVSATIRLLIAEYLHKERRKAAAAQGE